MKKRYIIRISIDNTYQEFETLASNRREAKETAIELANTYGSTDWYMELA